jgi:predicted RNA-binding Zn-ribbon protein involved in translation (DUF1610 family)
MPNEIVLPILTCNICGESWNPRKTTRPHKCPKCDSPNWDRTEFIRPSKKRASVGAVIERASSLPSLGA